ncbi:MAG: ATP-binding protein [Maribacter sp.]
MKKRRIVITGGPGTGKTVLVSALEREGYHCFHEVIRTMTSKVVGSHTLDLEKGNPIAFVEDSKAFNDQLITARLEHYLEGEHVERTFLFYDRGMPDVLAYMNYFDQAYDQNYHDLCTEHTYDEVLILPPWEAIYKQDNERMENFEQACAIHVQLSAMYRSLGYMPIEVPFGTVDERLNFVKRLISEAGA